MSPLLRWLLLRWLLLRVTTGLLRVGGRLARLLRETTGRRALLREAAATRLLLVLTLLWVLGLLLRVLAGLLLVLRLAIGLLLAVGLLRVWIRLAETADLAVADRSHRERRQTEKRPGLREEAEHTGTGDDDARDQVEGQLAPTVVLGDEDDREQ
jgi:hypothetical protein